MTKFVLNHKFGVRNINYSFNKLIFNKHIFCDINIPKTDIGIDKKSRIGID